jgi:hypothetical protein
MTESKELIGITMLIDEVFVWPHDRIVVEQTFQDIDRFPHGAGNDLRM